MEPSLWARMHGAAVHFPIALSVVAGGLDAAGLALATRPSARGLHRAGQVAMLGGAAGAVAAVASGLVMTRGQVLGHGAMRWHHLFAWPASGLLVGLAVWRAAAGAQPSRRALLWYVAFAALAGALAAAAGYWGGELLLGG